MSGLRPIQSAACNSVFPSEVPCPKARTHIRAKHQACVKTATPAKGFTCYLGLIHRVDMMQRAWFSALLLISITSGSVLAADLVRKAPLVPAAVAYDWSGVYVGGTLGAVWTEANRFMPDLPLVHVPPTTFTAHSTDGLYGAVLGAQWQMGRWVLGAEGSYNASFKDMQANVSVSPPEPFTKLSATTLITDLVTIGPRIGYT
jgi:hypothetical protein